MSASPLHPHVPGDAENHRNASYFPSLNTAKDRLLEQKRAEHEHARQEHRRRFEEQMQLLESKQQRDEAILNGVDEDVRVIAALPVTPVKTPGQCDARSRASTGTKASPPLKVFETRVTVNDQLATPPSDYQNRSSPSSFAPAKSVPGSRRTSTSLGFESLSLAEHPEPRRMSYIDQGRSFAHPEGHRLSMSKAYNEDVPATSYLQMNTTDDSFPILVRKDSHAGGLTPGMTNEFTMDNRKVGLPSAPSTFAGSALNRPSQISPQAHRGMLEDLEVAQNRPLPEFSLPSGQKSFPGPRNTSYDQESTRRAFSAMSTPGGRSPLGTLPSLSASMQSPVNSPGLYSPYNLLQSGYPPASFASFPVYGMNAHQPQMSTQEPRMHNPYTMGRNANYNKRSAEEVNRYADVALETLIGDIYSLCKDQHGCRYLQKKLDERNSVNVDIIFAETYSHAAELMIDPFGNYLCQKLLEHCDDQRRLKIVQSVAPDLVNISLNMHGTRAVQKMIEYLTTPDQIRIATAALDTNAVTLIKDLNGNHVIQKCLNRLGSSENQFIFDAVSKYCVEVATHRHGCCVLQRCIDHASDKQKMQIIAEINHHAPMLVQDPFGNYVVQYVLDLGEPRFSDPLIKRFIGSVCLFSVQKFSSNVIEKCLRVAEPATRTLLIEELLHKVRLEKLLRDSFANYVIQTALDYADGNQRQQLVECIRPLLPAIRSTPYGRRIQSKISGTIAGPYNNSFNIVPQVANFPGYGFQMPPTGNGLANIANYHKSFKGDYDY